MISDSINLFQHSIGLEVDFKKDFSFSFVPPLLDTGQKPLLRNFSSNFRPPSIHELYLDDLFSSGLEIKDECNFVMAFGGQELDVIVLNLVITSRGFIDDLLIVPLDSGIVYLAGNLLLGGKILEKGGS